MYIYNEIAISRELLSLGDILILTFSLMKLLDKISAFLV